MVKRVTCNIEVSGVISRVNIKFRVLGKSIQVLEKSWKFISGKECKFCETCYIKIANCKFVLVAKGTVKIDAFFFVMLHVFSHIE